jgi:hypothetical protein
MFRRHHAHLDQQARDVIAILTGQPTAVAAALRLAAGELATHRGGVSKVAD